MSQQLSLFAVPGGAKPAVNWTKADPEMLRRKEALAAGGPRGWRPNRLILMNYWHFTYEEFHFVQGRLVLRGSNGSGKSTALAAAITLTLDGEKRRERMDTFGGQGRSVAYYLVGHQTATPESDFYFHDRTAYVVLEFEHATQRRYASIGVGLYTSRGRPNLDVDFWGFTISDGRRPGIDLPLFDETPDGRIPLTERQLRERIGPGGQVTGRQGEYQRMVNALLFGMPEEEYDDLLKVLVHLRSPKLNKDIKPSDVCQILARSLPPLQEDLLAQVTRIIEDIDSQQDLLERTQRHLKAVAELDEKQDRYLNQLAQQAALDYREASGRQQAARTRLKSASDQVAALATRLNDARTALANLAVRRQEAQGRLEALERSPAFAEERDLQLAERDRNEAERALVKADAAVADSQKALERIGRELNRLAGRWAQELDLLQHKARDLASTAEAAVWPAASEALTGLLPATAALRLDEPGGDASGALAPILQLGHARLEALRGALAAVLEAEKAQIAHDAAQAALARSEAERDHAADQVTTAEDALYEARDEAIGKVHEWRGAARHDEMNELVDAIREYPQNGADLPAVADRVAARISRRPREEMEQQAGELRTRKAALRTRQEQVEQELMAWLNRAEAEPPRKESQNEARRLLASRSVPAVPLFAACDFRPGLDPAEAARLESVLADAG
ncbi:MAG TPA: AAA family ATPase, partial [Symbiobacteriaceae bacterium]|nr:AAA family ATPase [Symbiobacteriaceae bacterium]